MESNRLHTLIERFLSGDATSEEKAELNLWYRTKNNRDVDWQLTDPDEELMIEKRLFAKLNAHILLDNKESQSIRKVKIFRIAVAAACLLLIGAFLSYFIRVDNNEISDIVLASTEQVENRYVLLPDSSKVILRSGAQIEYRYTERERVVFLRGEAFFDVVKNKRKPFVVHAGDITTHVLGTSFNISAQTDKDVIVSVSTGKVDVRNKADKKLAVLVPNQQLEYRGNQVVSAPKYVETSELISWVNDDMQFIDVPFEKLVRSLNRRYDVEMVFENESLKNCLMTGLFDGTESLENVMDILTRTTGASYKWKEKKIILSGKGCPTKI